MNLKNKASNLYIIFKVILLLLGSLTVSGCVVYQNGGSEVYGVKSSTEKGKNFLQSRNIRYACKNVYEVFWTDTFREGCFFAVSKRENGEIKYVKLKNEVKNKFGLESSIKTIDRYGYLFVPLYAVVLFIFSTIAGSSRGYRYIEKLFLVIGGLIIFAFVVQISVYLF